MIRRVPAESFMDLSKRVPVIDVRSPGEYLRGHIPGAVNIPLFSDVQRAVVGAVYTHQGRAEAAAKALELVAPDLEGKLKKALGYTAKGEILLYCWRGGMRSESMAWMFSLAGLKPCVLEGGYKAFRNMALTSLSEKRKYIVLGGLTGSGKTKILNHFSSSGHQVVDLEGLACHKGSAFGSLGMPGQPTTEHFANTLFSQLSLMESDIPVWVEDESRNIGTVFLPDPFFCQIHEAPVIALMMPVEVRLPRLIEEYTSFPKERIIASLERITKRLGGDNTRKAVEAVSCNDFATAIRIVLEYYDRTYRYGLSQRREGQVTVVETDTDSVEINAVRIIEAASSLV